MKEKLRHISLIGLDTVLAENSCTARIFLSGAKLRAMRIEKKDNEHTLLRYGEHITFLKMLEHVSENCKKAELSFETTEIIGSSKADSMLDIWICNGGKIIIDRIGRQLILKLVKKDEVLSEFHAITLPKLIAKAEEFLEMFIKNGKIIEEYTKKLDYDEETIEESEPKQNILLFVKKNKEII